MSTPVSPSELKHLESYITTCLSDPGSMSHAELLQAIQENQELCTRAFQQLQPGGAEASSVASETTRVTAADVTFLESWLKAKNLMIGGMQLLQMADPDNAASVQHELECTETAFTLLPRLIADAKDRLS